MAEEEFQCRAINDYYASVTDELDLKEDATYTIMQTSPSGWWYAVNSDGEDGLFIYFVICYLHVISCIM